MVQNFEGHIDTLFRADRWYEGIDRVNKNLQNRLQTDPQVNFQMLYRLTIFNKYN